MSKKIQLTPAVLESQAKELENIESDLLSLFSGVSSELTKINTNWSPNLSNNFSGKITSAQKTFNTLCTDLKKGAAVARTSATTYASVDSELAKVYDIAAEKTVNMLGDLWDSIVNEIQDIPEDVAAAGDALEWIEKIYGKAPHWFTHGVNVLCPSSLKDAYTFTSHLLQGTLTLEDGYDIARSILSKNLYCSVIFSTFDYYSEKGEAFDAELTQNMSAEIMQGDLVGLVFEGAEGFVDGILGGSVEVLAKSLGGTIDSYLKDIGGDIPNKTVEYITGLFGINDGDGASIGDLVGYSGEAIAYGVDVATDIITDGVNFVTDNTIKGIKSGINAVKSWFD